MSCTTCNTPNNNNCYEAHLSLGLNNSKDLLIGSLNGQYIKPVPLRDAIRANETETSLRYNPATRTLIFENERSKNGRGAPDQISAQEMLAGADISAVGGVQPLVEGGLASVATIDDRLQVNFTVPIPIESGEISGGFISYVEDPNDGVSHYRLIRPDPSSTSGSLLIGDASGSVEFVPPITSPILVPVENMTSDGSFNGNPSTSAGSFRYQQMGLSQVITNTFKTAVEVTIRIRWSMQAGGSRGGMYAELVNGGTDYQTSMVEGPTRVYQEGYPGGFGEWTCKLDPLQKCQFRFTAWSNGAGNMQVVIGSYGESGGSAVQNVVQPSIFIRRLT